MDVPDETLILNNPFVMSTTLALGKYSFCNSKQAYNKLAPPPKYYSD